MSFVDFLDWLLDEPRGTPPSPPGRYAVNGDAASAARLMRRLNPHAFVGSEHGYACIVEDVWDSDSDRRLYRLEYQSTFDGRHAIAFCLTNPWGNSPNAGVAVTRGHVFPDGLICLSGDHARTPSNSRLDLETTVFRARYWTAAFSVLMETGSFPDL